MLDDFLESMKEHETALRARLADTISEETLQGIYISGNANLDIHKIDIDENLLNPERKEELEDSLIACYGAWKSKTEKTASEMSSGMVDDMFPPGMEDLFKNLK